MRSKFCRISSREQTHGISFHCSRSENLGPTLAPPRKQWWPASKQAPLQAKLSWRRHKYRAGCGLQNLDHSWLESCVALVWGTSSSDIGVSRKPMLFRAFVRFRKDVVDAVLSYREWRGCASLSYKVLCPSGTSSICVLAALSTVTGARILGFLTLFKIRRGEGLT